MSSPRIFKLKKIQYRCKTNPSTQQTAAGNYTKTTHSENLNMRPHDRTVMYTHTCVTLYIRAVRHPNPTLQISYVIQHQATVMLHVSTTKLPRGVMTSQLNDIYTNNAHNIKYYKTYPS